MIAIITSVSESTMTNDDVIEKSYLMDGYPLNIKQNFINLYKVEIIERLRQKVDEWINFEPLLGEQVVREHMDAFNATENQETKKSVTQSLFDKILSSHGESFKYLMVFLSTSQ